ncbi:MAG: Crp/Fnr family transcriptional regulator [Proteobacteria bacterium]|nr:Crp/Fnr family transcriptional regulator [Pseudomonadota bacterium]
MEKYKFIKQAELFKGLDDNAIKAIAPISEFISYPKNKMIVLNGDKATHTYIVISGFVKLYKTSFKGDETVTRIAENKEIFGEISCFSNAYHHLSAETINRTEILKIPQKELLQAIKLDENYNNKIIKWLFFRQKKLIKTLETQTTLNVDERLAVFITDLYKKANIRKGSLELPYNKNVIALQLSTKPETISRAFKRLEKQGLIHLQNKTITVHNIDQLKENPTDL